MEFSPGDTGESTEDLPGRKSKSKLKSLRSRLFGRTKRADGAGNTKFSQSARDITAGKGLGSEEDLVCSQGTLGSRALSHDSIFLADQVLPNAEPARVLSQENVSNVKALQMKLQQQKLNLGPPPLVLPIRRPEDHGSRSEEDGLTHSPPEISGGGATTRGAFSKATSQQSSRPLSPIPKPVPMRSAPLIPSLSSSRSAPSTSPPTIVAPPLDFSSLAQVSPCLDTSAARHRMAVKPRNQRASTKGKRLATTDSRPHLNNTDQPVSEKEDEEGLTAHEEVTHLCSHNTQILEPGQREVNIPVTSQCLPLKSPDSAYITSEPSEAQPPKSSSPTLSHQPTQQDHPGRGSSVVSRLIGVKSQKPVDVMSSQPHSSFIQPYSNEKKVSGDFMVQAVSHDKRDTLGKAGIADKKSNREHSSKDISVPSNQLSSSLGSMGAFRPSSVHQQVQGQTGAREGIKRPAPGSGSFHFSITTAKGQDGERPRSHSFLGVVEQAGARFKTGGETEVRSLSSSMSQKGKELQMDRQEEDKLRDLQSRGGPIVVGTPREEVTLHKGHVVQWDRTDSLKKGGPATPAKEATMDIGALEGKEVEDSQEVVEEAVEAKEIQEEEGKTAFGVKLRSTSLKFWSDAGTAHSESKHRVEVGSLTPPLAPYNLPSMPVLSEEKCDKRKREEIGDNASYMSKKLPINVPCTSTTSGYLKQTGGIPTQSGFSSLLVKHNLPAANDPHIIPAPPTEAQTISSNLKEVEIALSAPQEPQAAPQSTPHMASSGVSWMSLAMEKTRSLQQLFTSKLPRDFTSIQTAARPQAQVQPANQGQTVTQSHLQKVIQSETQIQTQTVKQQQSSPQLWATIQSSTEAAKPPIMQNASPEQTAKPPLTPTMVPQMTKQANDLPLQPNTTQSVMQSGLNSVSHPVIQTNPCTTQSPLRLSKQMETTPQSAQGSATQSLGQSHASSDQHPTAKQPPWSNRGLHQPTPTISAQASVSVSTPAPTSAPTSVPLLGRGERGAVLWTRAAGERSAFLEKQTEWTPPSGNKVELRKTQAETQTPAELPALPITTPSNKDRKPEGRQGVKLAESSPTNIPGRLADHEDKWLRKNMPSSSPSSLPATSSTLQSVSDSDRPSWMELAKRKSMAWSDKTTD